MLFVSAPSGQRPRPARLGARTRTLFLAALWLGACGSDDVGSNARDLDEDSDSVEEGSEERSDDRASQMRDASSSSKRDAGVDTGRSRDASTASADAATMGHGHTQAMADAAADAGAGTGGAYDHCTDGERADPSSAGLADQPAEWKSPGSGAVDLVLPPKVLAWMGDRVWEASHDAWHNVRRCRSGANPFANAASRELCGRPEFVPEHQECADAGDGYEFLVMHRHMMQALRQAFPTTPDLFKGFATFPYEAKDVPEAWRGRFGTGWSASIKDTAKTLEAIESNLSRFATEGDLGRFIQCGGMAGAGANSIHGALHFKWVVNDSPHSLGKQTVNVDNYMFWKLHGWIDQIWERYRVAKGLSPDEPKLKEELVAQCREMHALGTFVGGKEPVTTSEPLPEESGVFHETVRPILERVCSGCHSESSPEASLPLGGKISSADIVKSLVNVQARRGGQFVRVKAGEPEQSWLYLKVSGKAASAGCTGTSCNTQFMPPAGQVTLTKSELDAIAKWITDGAPAP